jgi:hypothetical protein
LHCASDGLAVKTELIFGLIPMHSLVTAVVERPSARLPVTVGAQIPLFEVEKFRSPIL